MVFETDVITDARLPRPTALFVITVILGYLQGRDCC